MPSQRKPVEGRNDLVKTEQGVVLNIDKTKLQQARAKKAKEQLLEQRLQTLEATVEVLKKRLGI